MTNHAVLSKDGLTVLQAQTKQMHIHRELTADTVSSIDDLLSMALVADVSHLWVQADSGIVPNKAFASYDTSTCDLSRQNWTKQDMLKTVTGWKLPKGGQQQVTIIFPSYTRWATSGTSGQTGWASRCTPQELLITVYYLEKALGVPVAGSPSSVGWRVLKGFHPEWIQAGDDQMPHFGAESARDLVWQRPYVAGEGRYLHKFDKNSAYLASAEMEFYGVGKLYQSSTYDGKQVGVWRVTATRTIADELPPIFKKENSWSGWVAGPIIRLLRSQSYEVQIHEGLTFEKRHQVLGKWAQTVWNARQSFATDSAKWPSKVGARMAREAVKQIAVATVGITGYKGYEEDEHSDKNRPDIKMQTVARTYEVMYHNISKMQRSYGVHPLMVYTDALYYLSDNPDGRAAFPELVARSDKLGGFKYEGAIEVNQEVTDILTAKQAVNEKLHKLNQIGWEK